MQLFVISSQKEEEFSVNNIGVLKNLEMKK